MKQHLTRTYSGTSRKRHGGWFDRHEAYLYISIHQSPFYPFTGVQDDDANVLNVPLNNGTSGSSFLNAIRTSVLPRLRKYDPQILFLSAGFDAHRDDPLADMTLESSDFAAVTKTSHCVSPTVSCLEGDIV